MQPPYPGSQYSPSQPTYSQQAENSQGASGANNGGNQPTDPQYASNSHTSAAYQFPYPKDVPGERTASFAPPAGYAQSFNQQLSAMPEAQPQGLQSQAQPDAPNPYGAQQANGGSRFSQWPSSAPQPGLNPGMDYARSGQPGSSASEPTVQQLGRIQPGVGEFTGSGMPDLPATGNTASPSEVAGFAGYSTAASFSPGMTQTFPSTVAARAEHLSKIYGEGDAQVIALRDINLTFNQREFTAIMGPSGSGKSTLMHCMAGLDRASEGNAFLGDVNLTGLTDKQITALRRDRLGFIFQSFNLVPTLTARENITLPSDVAGKQVDQAWFDEVVHRLGIAERLEHRPAELSGGQQQRVACARALVSRPEIIFGDEPTGNLDSNSSREVLQILRSAVDEFQQTVVIVTHDPKAASYADRVIFLADGQIIAELREPTSEAVLAMMAEIEKRA